jgi:hypothetical protein
MVKIERMIKKKKTKKNKVTDTVKSTYDYVYQELSNVFTMTIHSHDE